MIESTQNSGLDAGKIRVLLVDDHPLIRESLKMLIGRESDLIVCGEAEDRDEALALVAACAPDLALVDLNLKNSHGMELIKDLVKLWPRLKMLVLSVQEEEHYAERVIRSGACGFVSKREPPVKIVQAIRRVLAGEIYWSEKSAATVASKIARSPASRPSGVEFLTDREIQVFELIGLGKATRHIAESLHLNTSTVETYRARIKEKLNLQNSNELLQHAIRWVNHPKN